MATDLEVRDESIAVDGLVLHVLASGSGEPLVYLHGEDRAGTWGAAQRLLAGAGFRVVAPDLPGFGRSERLDCREDVWDYAFLLLDWLEAAGLRRVHLAGLSLGGWVAAAMASIDPSHLSTLTLAAPLGLDLAEPAPPDVFVLSPADWMRLLYADPEAAERRLAEPLDDEAVTAEVRGRVTFARLGWNPYLADPKLARRLGRARVPALLLWGEADRLLPPAAAEAWREALPDAEVRVLPGCGHLPPSEQPEAFAREVGSFIARRAQP